LYLSEKAGGQERRETLDVDAVFVATGYHRDLHETLLKDARHLMPGGELADAKWRVQRNYKIDFVEKSVGQDAGVWLQGCCESTHGVSLPSSLLPEYAREYSGGDLEKRLTWL
jgi:L-ornithine N5-oxygenase